MINDFFNLKKKQCFTLEICRFLCFCEINIFQNLWRHHRHCYIMEVTLMLIFLNPKYYQNETWSNTSTLYKKTFLTCFWLNAGDWKLVLDLFIILFKWQYSKIWPFLIVDIYHFKLSLINLFKKWNTGILP